jgi:hypothetical protein
VPRGGGPFRGAFRGPFRHATDPTKGWSRNATD